MSFGFIAAYTVLIAIASLIEVPIGRGFASVQLNLLIRLGGLVVAALAMVVVHGFTVDRAKAVAGEWQGQTFYFCSRGCKAEFMVDPATFVGEAAHEASPSSKG